MDDKMNTPKDRVSALMDGQLQTQELAGVFAEMEATPELVSTWHVYQLIGDVMRSEDLAAGVHDRAFLTRLEAKLVQEPVPMTLAPQPRDLPTVAASANADVFRWKWVSGIAMSAVVAVVGFGLWNQSTQPQLQASLATPPVSDAVQASSVQAEQQVMLRDPQLDALMVAHQQLGGHSALQMPSGFLRNATFERSSR